MKEFFKLLGKGLLLVFLSFITVVMFYCAGVFAFAGIPSVNGWGVVLLFIMCLACFAAGVLLLVILGCLGDAIE